MDVSVRIFYFICLLVKDKKSPGIAKTVLRGFRKQIESLSDSPKRHSLDEDEELSKL